VHFGRRLRATTSPIASSLVRPAVRRLRILDERARSPRPLLADQALFNISPDDISRSREATVVRIGDNLRSATWFIPPPRHVAFGGLFTIFRAMSHFCDRGMEPRLAIYADHPVDIHRLRSQLALEFPNLAGIDIRTINPALQELEMLEPTDAAFCTYWTTAYLLLRFNRTSRKFYFVQDFEPSFFEAGPLSALADSTYRFGFTGIFNTPGVAAAVQSRYEMPGISFVPAVDPRYRESSRPAGHRTLRIVFYARPDKPRNAFDLGIGVIRQLIDRYGDRVEVVTAGGDWSPDRFRFDTRVRSLGLLPSIDAVAALYRSCDIGFVYMLSKHPSYQPLEFMASGVATVTNFNSDNLWFLRDGENCLLAEPSPPAMAEAVGRLVEDADLRTRIVQGGSASVSRDWSTQLERVWSFLRQAPVEVVVSSSDRALQ
jgi:O-antigen biosynthesis protein